MTKAEKIFKDTYYECKNHIKFWGFNKEAGFNYMVTEDEMSTRTFNDIQKWIDKKTRELALAKQYGALDAEALKLNAQALWMTKKTLENTIKNEKAFQEKLNEIRSSL